MSLCDKILRAPLRTYFGVLLIFSESESSIPQRGGAHSSAPQCAVKEGGSSLEDEIECWIP